MKFGTITTLSAATLALAACGKTDETTAGTTANTSITDTGNDMAASTPTPSGGQAFANAAAASDAFEIATSRLALTSATSSAVKSYAQKMIDAHTDSTAKLQTAAAGASITPDPTLTAEQQATLDSLKAAKGAAFDTAYIAGQTDGHQRTLDTLRAYSASGDVPTLKAFATTLTPIVAAHLNMVKSLKA